MTRRSSDTLWYFAATVQTESQTLVSFVSQESTQWVTSQGVRIVLEDMNVPILPPI